MHPSRKEVPRCYITRYQISKWDHELYRLKTEFREFLHKFPSVSLEYDSWLGAIRSRKVAR